MDVQVNASEWNGLSKEDRDKIQAIIAANFRDVTISADNAAEPAMQALARPMASFNFSNPFGSAAYNVAEAAAIAACSALPGPLVPICVALAHAAGNLCRRNS
jgi:hypothetical protein